MRADADLMRDPSVAMAAPVREAKAADLKRRMAAPGGESERDVDRSVRAAIGAHWRRKHRAPGTGRARSPTGTTVRGLAWGAALSARLAAPAGTATPHVIASPNTKRRTMTQV